jgi:hypothetical protein
MPSTISLYVAIYNDGGVYKHWSLFLDGPKKADKRIFHVMGSDGNFRYDTKNTNARRSQSLLELVYLGEVKASDADRIEDIARRLPVQNNMSGWNCQDYVLDLLEALEEAGIIDGEDSNYKGKKDTVRGKQEGFA